MEAIQAVGFRLDPELRGSAADCSSDGGSGGGGKCSPCHASCYNSPRG